jgi:hypothetical protein
MLGSVASGTSYIFLKISVQITEGSDKLFVLGISFNPLTVSLSATFPQFVDFARSVVTNVTRAVHKRLKYSKDPWLTVFINDHYT